MDRRGFAIIQQITRGTNGVRAGAGRVRLRSADETAAGGGGCAPVGGLRYVCFARFALHLPLPAARRRRRAARAKGGEKGAKEEEALARRKDGARRFERRASIGRRR